MEVLATNWQTKKTGLCCLRADLKVEISFWPPRLVIKSMTVWCKMILIHTAILSGFTLESKIQEQDCQSSLIFWTTIKLTQCSITVWKSQSTQKKSQIKIKLVGIGAAVISLIFKTRLEKTLLSQSTSTQQLLPIHLNTTMIQFFSLIAFHILIRTW